MIRRYRGVFAFLLAIIVSLGAGTLPQASATVNGGPWDIGMSYWNVCPTTPCGNTSGSDSSTLSYDRIYMSVDHDDYTGAGIDSEYQACEKQIWHRNSPVTIYNNPGMTKTGSGGGSGWLPITDRVGIDQSTGGVVGASMDVQGIRIQAAGKTCDAGTFGSFTTTDAPLQLRAYSGTTYDPLTAHIVNAGDFTSNPSTRPTPPAIASSGGSITTHAIPTIAPSLQVSAGNNSWSATIGVNPNPSSPFTGETYTYDIDWGDGSTHATTNSAQHFYANSNTYTAVAKVTGVISNGDAYTDGTTTKVVTQNVTVCWAATCTPTTTTTVAPSGDNGTGSGDCDFWDVPCLLTKAFRALFFPSSSTLAGMSHLWDSVTTKAPFSVLVEVVSFIPDNLADMSAAVVGSASGVGTGCGQQWSVDGRTITHFPCNDVTTGGGPAHYTLSGNNTDTTGGGYTKGGVNYTGLFREIFLLIAGLLFIYATYRGCAEILK